MKLNLRIPKVRINKTKILTFLKKFFTKRNLIYVLPIIFAGLVIYLVKTVFLAAYVNGSLVSRISVLKAAEEQSGKLILDNLIEKNLIFKEARKNNIKITKKEIEDEITKIEDLLKNQNITLEQALLTSNQTKKDLEEQIKIQKIVESILGVNINISETEIKDYFDKNKAYFGTNAKLETFKDQIKDEIFKQKLTTEYTKWIEELKAKAKIFYFVKY